MSAIKSSTLAKAPGEPTARSTHEASPGGSYAAAKSAGDCAALAVRVFKRAHSRTHGGAFNHITESRASTSEPRAQGLPRGIGGIGRITARCTAHHWRNTRQHARRRARSCFARRRANIGTRNEKRRCFTG